MRRHLLMGSRLSTEAYLREHLVCWFSPAKQGATNESLAVDPTLVDFSGKGNDLKLVGFAWDENNGIAADGGLNFHREHYWHQSAYGITANLGPLNGYTYIIDRKMTADTSCTAVISKYDPDAGIGFVGEATSNQANTRRLYVRLNEVEFMQWSNATTEEIVGKRGIAYMTPYFWNFGGGDIALNGEYTDTYSPLIVGTSNRSDGDKYGFEGTIYEVLFFDVALTKRQIRYAINNLINK